MSRLGKLCKQIDHARAKIGILSNPIKTGITFLIAHLTHPTFIHQTKLFRSTEFQYDFFWPVFIHLTTSLAFYMTCSIAFKLRMHRFCFALPITLLTPVSLILACFICQFNIDRKFWIEFKEYYRCQSFVSSDLVWHLVLGVCLWWLSHLVMNGQIWNRFAQIHDSKFQRYDEILF